MRMWPVGPRDLLPPSLSGWERVRRLDWRFLLPEPDLGRTAYVGPREGALPEALKAFARPFVPVNEERGRSGDEDCDLAVVASRDREDLARALRRVRPGGHLYWEVDRRPLLRRSPSGDGRWPRGSRAGRLLANPSRTLEGLGLVDVRVGCPFPSIQRPKTILSPDPAAVRLATSMRNGGTFGMGPILDLASRMGLLPRILPTLAVVGRRPGGAAWDGGIAAAQATKGSAHHHAIHDGPWILLTPWPAFFVVALLVDDATGEPVSVVKATGLPGDQRATHSLDREAQGLQRAGAAPLPHPDSIPRVRARRDGGDTHQLALSPVPGRSLTRRDIRRRPSHWIGQAVDWLSDLHRATLQEPPSALDRRERLVETPLRTLASHLPPTRGYRLLVHRARSAMGPLEGRGFPSVLEHGDFCPSNLLATRSGGVSVVDWEFAEPEGFPGTDLFFLLASVAVGQAGGADPQRAERAFRHAFGGREGWARPWIHRYWSRLDLPVDAAPAAFVATWTRLAARLAWRPDESMMREGGTDLARGLRRHRYFRFWVDALGGPVGEEGVDHPAARSAASNGRYANLATGETTP